MKRIFSLTIACLLCLSVFSQGIKHAEDDLYKGFQSPPDAAKPRVWWHWMNGNITKEGIKKDLLWMNRVGIGGFQTFDAGLSTPQVVKDRLSYMTPEWKDAFRYATFLADSLHLEMAIASSPGWSQTGGPWVSEKDGMKKIVWRELRLKGGINFKDSLPQPYTVTGDFQNIPLDKGNSLFSVKLPQLPEYYQDIAILAYKIPDNDIPLASLEPRISSSAGQFTLKQLTDGDLSNSSLLPRDDKTGYAWIQYEFKKPQIVKAISIVGGLLRDQWGMKGIQDNRSLEVSDDGVNFKRICFIPDGGIGQSTLVIPETTARFFRVTFKNPPPSKYAAIAAQAGVKIPLTPGIDISELVLYPISKINHAEEKAGFAAMFDSEKLKTPASKDAISRNTVIDITEYYKNNILEWKVPSGNWKIVRFGYSLTGKQNHPASPEATGLEVDKLDGKAVKEYYNKYLDLYKDATAGLIGKHGLQFVLTDSYEAGLSTWTPGMLQEFEKRRGYSLINWLPVLTGEIIDNSVASEQFLLDWRKTIGELTTENSYDQLTNILAEKGMGRYSESHESGRCFLADGMEVKRKATVPMSAMWIPDHSKTTIAGEADIRESASVAHIYGQNIVAAESFTTNGLYGNAWSYCPENIKPVADIELASGLNRFVIHCSVHQPVDDKIPGLSLMVFGQWFNRHDTWAEQAKAWTDYLSRSSFMLQQGRFVADIVYYYGEDDNITNLFAEKSPIIPRGYNFDYINSDALMNMLSVDKGRLVTHTGMSYRVLVLDDNAKKMSLPVLRKIAQLVNNGAVICGVKPVQKAGLSDDQKEFNRLVAEIWNKKRANVFTGKTIQEVVQTLNIQPDFEYKIPQDSTNLLYVHRQLNDTDIYWVNNRSSKAQNFEVSFRTSGKQPEIWHPETGKKESASYKIANGRTTVMLNMSPNDAQFVVFDKPAKETSVTLPQIVENPIMNIEGPWNVSFQPNRGAPANATFDKLASYTENSDEGVKYFSGTASYTRKFQLSDEDIKSGELCIDLGDVKNLAEVIVNGKSLGVVWKKPFRINISHAVKEGENSLEIKVTNLWVNRLIGDKQPDMKQKITFTTMPFYRANSPLLTSGLLGPVRIISLK